MLARVLADALEVVVVQAATDVLVVVTMTAAVPDDNLARATHKCRPFFLQPHTSIVKHALEISLMDKKFIHRYDMFSIIYQSPR